MLSTTGVPEGCNLAVMCTLFLAYAFHACQQETPNITPFAYADNWALLTNNASDLHAGIRSTICFCDAFSLQLALSKSWIWPLSPKERRVMKQRDFNNIRIR